MRSGSPLVFRNNRLSFAAYAGVSLRYLLQTRPRYYFWQLLLFGLLGTVGYQLVKASVPAPAAWRSLLPPYLLLTALLLLVGPLPMWWKLRRNYATSPLTQAVVEYRFSELGVEIWSADNGRTWFSWDAFEDFHDFGRYGILTTSQTAGFFLDFRALQPLATKADFRRLLEAVDLDLR